jgi:hypothetical protein
VVVALGSTGTNGRVRETKRWGRRDGVGRFFFLREADKVEWKATSEWTRADEHPCRSISDWSMLYYYRNQGQEENPSKKENN